MTYKVRLPHINKPICPSCLERLIPTIEEGQIFSIIWECLTCGYKRDKDGNVTTVVTHDPEELRYALWKTK